MTSSGFPAHALSPPSGEEETVADMNGLLDLKNRIWELLRTTLDNSSFTVMQERLLLKQRSSYYFVIQKEDVRPWENQQESTSMSINMLGSHLGSRRLQHVKDWMKSQIVFLLAYLEMLFQEIITSRKNLEAFVAKCEKVEVDADEIASAEQQLQQIQLHLSDFEARMASNLEPLTLNSLFLLHARGSLTHQSQMSVVTLGPVMFHREKSLLTPKSVCLFWYIAGEHTEEPRRMFRITVKSAAPGGKLWREAVCCNYEHCVQNLQPDTYYTFTVKRITTFTLVHVPWTDTLHLKTLSSTGEQGLKGIPNNA